MELLLLLRFGAAFLALRRLRDLRFADFLLGAAFLREARRLFGAMMIKCISFCVGVTLHDDATMKEHNDECRYDDHKTAATDIDCMTQSHRIPAHSG